MNAINAINEPKARPVKPEDGARRGDMGASMARAAIGNIEKDESKEPSPEDVVGFIKECISSGRSPMVVARRAASDLGIELQGEDDGRGGDQARVLRAVFRFLDGLDDGDEDCEWMNAPAAPRRSMPRAIVVPEVFGYAFSW